MAGEHHRFEKESLRNVLGPRVDWQSLADSCVAFATAAGGTLIIGIEDDSDLPAQGQRIPHDLPDTIRHRMGELTVNVCAQPEVRTADNRGGEFIELHVPRSVAVHPLRTSAGDGSRQNSPSRVVLEGPVLTDKNIACVDLNLSETLEFAIVGCLLTFCLN